jgi:hypothetical protein
VSTVVSLRLLSLLQDGCLLPESLPGLPSVFVCVLIFSFYKDNSQTGLGPLTWSHFNHRYRRSLSKYLAFLGPEGQDFSK